MLEIGAYSVFALSVIGLCIIGYLYKLNLVKMKFNKEQLGLTHEVFVNMGLRDKVHNRYLSPYFNNIADYTHLIRKEFMVGNIDYTEKEFDVLVHYVRYSGEYNKCEIKNIYLFNIGVVLVTLGVICLFVLTFV